MKQINLTAIGPRLEVNSWRWRARYVIQQVLDRHNLDTAAPADVAKAIDAAYPFGVREFYPYTAWLAERHLARVALGLADPKPEKQTRTLEPTRDELIENGQLELL
jgi:hypothetical protein